MSKRARSRIDKRDVSLDLARAFGHGTPMPDEEADTEADESAGWWHESPTEQRTPIGPLDVATNRNQEDQRL